MAICKRLFTVHYSISLLSKIGALDKTILTQDETDQTSKHIPQYIVR